MKKLLFLLLFPIVANAAQWNCVTSSYMTCNTWRLEVPTGWIVSSIGFGEHSYAMVVVPDQNHEWKI